MTVTSNIHDGITAWAASTAYSLAARRSNGGNAYQVITAGTSAGSGGPSGTGSSISDGTAVWKWLSAVDYTTIDSWIASLPGTLAQPYVGLLWNDGNISRTTPITISGHTTTIVNQITLQCAPGESFDDNPASNPLAPSASYGVQITRTPQYGQIVVCSDNYTVFSGLQLVAQTSGISVAEAMRLTNNITFTRCLIQWRNNETPAFGIILGLGGGLLTFTNCVFIDKQQAGGNSQFYRGSSSNVLMANCTIYSAVTSSSNAFDTNYSATIALTNVILFGYTAFSNNTWTAKAARNNLTDLAAYSAGWVDTGSATLFSQTASAQFVNAASDYKLKSGAPAINAGFTDTTDIPAAIDIYGTARPQGSAWDIGCYELAVAGVTWSMMTPGQHQPIFTRPEMIPY